MSVRLERIVLLRDVTLELTGPIFWQDRRLALIPEEIVLTGVRRIVRLEAKGRITTRNWTGGDLDGWLTALDMQGRMLPGEPVGGWRIAIDWGFFDTRTNAPFRNTSQDVNYTVPVDEKGRPVPIKLVPRIYIFDQESITGLELSAVIGYVKAEVEEFAVVVEREEVLYSLTVRVYDASTNQPIAGATVTVGGTSKQTDSTGTVEFLLPGGSYDLTVSKDGYGGYAARVNLTSDTALNVALHPRPDVHVIELLSNEVLEGSVAYYGAKYAANDWYIERCDELLHIEVTGEIDCDNWTAGDARAYVAVVDSYDAPLPGEPAEGYNFSFDWARGLGRYRGPFRQTRLNLNVSVGRPVWVRSVAARWFGGERATKVTLSVLGGYCRVSIGSLRLVYRGTAPLKRPPRPVEPVLPKIVVRCVRDGKPVEGVEVRCYSQWMSSLIGAARTGPDGTVVFQAGPGGYIILAHHHELKLTAEPVFVALGLSDAAVEVRMVRKPARITIEATVRTPFADPSGVANQLRGVLEGSGLRVEEVTVSGSTAKIVAVDEEAPAWVYLALILAILVAFYLVSLRVRVEEVVKAAPEAVKWWAVGMIAAAAASVAAALVAAARRE
ncbi:MAG: carboxypeptidase regulatory-like domain-containing protein [Thermofilaceae archaeon]